MPARADDLQTFEWTWYPEDTLDALDVLLVYSGYHEKLARPQITCTRGKQPKILKGRRCLHMVALKGAYLLHHFWLGRAEGGRGVWFVHPNADYRERLRSAGINPDTVQIEDKEKWAIAWWQLTHQYRPRFLIEVQKKLIAKGFKAPEPEPRVYQRTFTKASARKRLKQERLRNEAAPQAEPDYENEPHSQPTIGAMLSAQRSGHDLIRMG